MPIDEELAEILLQWEEAREQGSPIDVEELCRRFSSRAEEIRRQIDRLDRVSRRLTLDEATDPHSIRLNAVAHTRFRSIRPQAKGGLGEIHLARDEVLGRDVALKLIQPPEDESKRKRFLREAEITASLAHPGVVPIHAVGETEDGRICYVMRFIEGETLREAVGRLHGEKSLKPPPFDLPEFRSLIQRFVTVCQTIAYAHSRGVIHRDLKPSNIMLGPFQETLVVDWGLAKRIGERSSGGEETRRGDGEDSSFSDDDRLTRAGSAFGTPAYMSPEQAAGRSHEIGPATDIHGLGATLYHLLAGRSAYGGRSRSNLLDQVARGEFPRPRSIRPMVPRPLEAICLRAMSTRPEDRYPSALALSEDLERWLADEPVSTYREPWTKRLSRRLRRNRPIVAGVSALIATGVIALGVSAALLRRERDRTSEALIESRASNKLARARLNDMRTNHGLTASLRGSISEAALWMAQAADPAESDAARSRVARVQVGGWSRLTALPIAVVDLTVPAGPGRLAANPVDRLAFDGTGRRLAALDRRGRLAVHDVVEDRPIPLRDLPSGVRSFAWVGRARDRIAAAHAEGVSTHSVSDGSRIRSIDVEQGVVDLDVSGDGDLIAMVGDRLLLRRISDDRFAPSAVPLPSRASRVSTSRDGGMVAVVTKDRRVRMFDAAGQTAATIEIPDAPDLPPILTPDGASIFIVVSENRMVRYGTRSGTREASMNTGIDRIVRAFPHPREKVIAVATTRGVQFWHESPPRLTERLPGVSSGPSCFMGDGTSIFVPTTDHSITPFRFADGRRANWELPMQRIGTVAVVSPDGGSIAAAQEDGLVRVFRMPDFASGDWTFPAYARGDRLTMSRDGRYVMAVGGRRVKPGSNTRRLDLDERRAGPLLNIPGILGGGAVAPDGEQVVTLEAVPPTPSETVPRAGLIRLWDPVDGKQTAPAIATPSVPVSALYDHDGTRFHVACERGEILTFDRSGRETGRLSGNGDPSAASGPTLHERLVLSRDGTKLLRWGIGPTLVIDLATWKGRVLPSEAGSTVLEAVFSPDGRLVAEALDDGRVAVRDADDGRIVGPTPVHPDAVIALTFSADGSRILTGCRDGGARVWDRRSGQLVAPPIQHGGAVTNVGFLRNDRWIVTKAANDMILLSDLETGAPLVPIWLRPGIGEGTTAIDPAERRLTTLNINESVIHVIDLVNRVDEHAFGARDDEVRPIAELISGRKVVRESVLVDLTSLEWLERWQRLHDRMRERLKAIAAPSADRPATPK